MRRNQDYRTEVGLWQVTVAQAPRHARARANLGAALLDAGRTEEGIRALFEALALDTQDGYVSLSVSPVAYLKLGNGAEAIAEYQKILDHRGEAPLSALYPLAHLGLARAAVLQGETAKARKKYQEFFTIWKDADSDLPVLIKAKKEFEKVK